MSLLTRLLVIATFVLLGIPAAHAHDQAATERAFDALLSMPQAQPPDNNWNVQAPQGYDGSSEGDLIAWLAQQRQDGADINAYHHQGTLLQHAIRSHMTEVARWLLAHGADPTLPMKDATGMDTLGYAIEQGQWPLVDSMRAMRVYRRLSPQQLTARYLPFVPESFEQLLYHGFAMPEGETARCLLQYELEKGNFKLALRLPSTRLPNGDDKEKSAWGWCHRPTVTRGRAITSHLASLDPDLLRQLDARLEQPLLPYLLPTLATAQDAQTLFSLPLRKPVDTAALEQLLRPWIVPQDAASSLADGFLPLAVRESACGPTASDAIQGNVAKQGGPCCMVEFGGERYRCGIRASAPSSARHGIGNFPDRGSQCGARHARRHHEMGVAAGTPCIAAR